MRAHSLALHASTQPTSTTTLSLARCVFVRELNIRESACVFFLAQLLLLLFKLTPPPPPEFAAAHMCTCHLYLLGPRNQSRALSPRFVWRRCCILRLSLVYMYACLSLAGSKSCSLLMRGCAVCARGAFISVIAQIHARFMEFESSRCALPRIFIIYI